MDRQLTKQLEEILAYKEADWRFNAKRMGEGMLDNRIRRKPSLIQRIKRRLK